MSVATSEDLIGSFTLIIGSMMSNKSTQLISHINRFRHIGRRVLVINHSKDTRYGRQSVITHDGLQLPCTMVDTLCPLFETEEYLSSDVIAIEEMQFFDSEDAVAFCTRACDLDGKHVIAAALQGDRHRDAWPTVSSLIPIADRIQQTTGLCTTCADGTPGCFTKRITPESENLVGGSKDYACLCRKHYVRTP